MKFFNKLEQKFGRYAIHNLMYYIIILYVVGFVMMYTVPEFFVYYLSLDAHAILHGQVWRLFTFLLYPPTTSPFWIIFAILMYYSLGRSLEAVWGAFRFNVFFFMGVLGIILAEFVVYFLFGWDMNLNTTYLNMTIFLAYAATFPEEWFYVYFIIAVKAKWLALLDGFFLVYNFAYGSMATKIAIILALANFIIFFLMTRDYKKYSPREIKRKQEFRAQTTIRPQSMAVVKVRSRLRVMPCA